MHLGDIPRRNSQRFPNKTSFIFEDNKFTWKETNNRVNSLANALISKGFKKGDRIGILMKNCHQYWESYWGLSKVGILAIPLNYRLKEKELLSLVGHAEIQGIIASNETLTQVQILRDKTKIKLYVLVGAENQNIGKDENIVNYEDLIKEFPQNEPNVKVDENDIFSIFYTSGTTGLPKGALVSHRNLLSNSLNQIIADKSVEDDINLTVSPLYHMGAVFVGTTYTLLGCTNIIHRSYKPQKAMESIQEEKATVCLLIPTMVNMMLNDEHFGKYDLSSLRLIFYGGGPMPYSILEKAMKEIGCSFTQGYGLTETLEATFLVASDHVLDGTEQQKKRLTSAGREAVAAEVRIVDDQGNELPQGEPGEVIVKSASVIQGYWKMPELNAEVIKDGWFYTGDIGYFDEDRYLYIVDRKKDMIISGGVNIFPKEIEEVLYNHPGIKEAAVIGVPDIHWGESILAVIVPKAGQVLQEEEIIEYCKKRLASYKKPSIVKFVDELPKNPSGKILKRELREMFSKTKSLNDVG